jgi:hypothetical protein
MSPNVLVSGGPLQTENAADRLGARPLDLKLGASFLRLFPTIA